MSARFRHILFVSAGLGAALPGVAAADPVIRTSATATLGGAYERNPFLVAGDDTDAGSIQGEIRPRVDIIDTRATAAIEGYYNRNEYLSKYGGNDAIGAVVTGNYLVNSRWTLSPTASFDSSVLGANNGFGQFRNVLGITPSLGSGASDPGAVDVAAPVTPVPILDPTGGVIGLLPGADAGLIGLRQRRNLLSGGLGIGFRPSARNSWNLGLNAARNWYPGSTNAGGNFFASDFDTYGANAGYSRELSETRTVGVRLSVSQVDYDIGGSTRIYTPQLTFTQRLSGTWTVTGAVGAGIVDGSGGLFQASDGTTISVQVSACRALERTSICLSGDRTPTTTGFGGVRTQTNVQLSVNHRLAERSSVSAFVSYGHTDDQGEAVGLVNLGEQDFVTANASYSQRLTRRVSLVGSIQYRDISTPFYSAKSDIGGRLGLSVAIGDLQ